MIDTITEGLPRAARIGLAGVAVFAAGGAASVVTAGAAGAAGAAGTAGTATCPYNAPDHTTSGARANWSLVCQGGEVTVSGWVKDTDADGECARVKAKFVTSGNWKFSNRACPAGEVESYIWTETGNQALVYLYEEA